MAKFWTSSSKHYVWQQCKRLFYYEVVLNLEPRMKKTVFSRGDLYHSLVQEWILTKDKVKVSAKLLSEKDRLLKLYRGNPEKTAEIEKDIFSATWHMLRYMTQKQDFIVDKIEVPVEMQLSGDIWFKGRADAFGKIRSKRAKAVWELKTKARTEVDQISERCRPQAVLYAKAAKYCRWIIRETIFVPSLKAPEITQKGALSKAKITSTWALYQHTAKTHGIPFDLDTYGDMKDKLYFPVRDVLVTQITPTLTSNIEEGFIEEAKNMKKEKVFARSHGPNCTFCAFKEPCFAGLQGGDETFMLNKFFKNRSQPVDDKEAD